MIVYRPYINTDPPALVEIWNEACTGRGAYPVRSPIYLERWLFSRLHFRRDDMVVAVEDGKIVGFSISGFGPDEEQNQIVDNPGIVCGIVVRPSHQRKGIGTELLRRSEENLKQRGAQEIVVGAMWPRNPFLFGLYGGSNSPGILTDDVAAKPFLAKQGYERAESTLVLQKKLEASSLSIVDTRFGMLRRRYEFQWLRAATVASWWQDTVWGTLEPVELRLIDKLTNIPAARAVVWELEGFGWKWGATSAGILACQVRPDLRQQGLGKLLLSQVLRFLLDQFFERAELQIRGNDPAGAALCKSLGFEEIDRGFVYRKAGTFESEPLPPQPETVEIAKSDLGISEKLASAESPPPAEPPEAASDS